MAKGEHDKVDERLIVHGPRRLKPSEKAKGKAYPKTVTADSPSSIPSSTRGRFCLVDEIAHHTDNDLERFSILPMNNKQLRKCILLRQEKD
jgi:hypothetical protein